MSNKICRAAIETRLLAWAAARAPALKIAVQNVAFNPPDGAYLRGTLLPAGTTSSDLAGAHRTYRGVYQVDVVTKINIGPGEAEAVADEIAALFPLNLVMPKSGLNVQVITPVTAAQGAPDGSTYVTPVSFQYRADFVA
jgi:hypothetical protein